ncbi:DUF4232 domain-containing protein [Williamsia sp. Leaf354]|uniref:DUF4232 domain-containing protein n=1 Tax=Williamsia sp. Leaf354 TaxID=1736349 RepID=UPI0012E33938|nr:DUF4232 domain-containing protein [Williamsia sp. Leaf354]
MIRKSVCALVATIGLAAATAACSSGSDTPATTTTVTVMSNADTRPVSPDQGVPGSPTADPGSVGTSPADATGVARCRAADLVGTVTNRGGGTAGPEYGTLALTNTGSTACTVTGYPGVSFVGDGNGKQLGAAAVRDGSTVVTSSIAPRGVATARLEIAEAGDFPGCDQVRADGLRIYPPGDRDALFVRTTYFTACRSMSAHLLTVGPLR